MTRTTVLCVMLALVVAAPISPALSVDDAIWSALRDEMARSVESLQLEDLERPYYIEYRVDDVHQHVVTASFGSLVLSRPTRMRMLTVDVRVGDHNLDNSEFVSTEMFRQGRFVQSKSLPLTDDYYAIRRTLWLETDNAYKIGLEVLAKKRALRENKVEEDLVPDFSVEQPHVAIGEAQPYEFDVEEWEKRIRSLSEVFRDYPDIHESKAELRVHHMVRYYVNSEGSEYRKTEPSAIVYATAATYAEDGAVLKDYVSYVMPLPGDAPGINDLEKSVREMAAGLTTMRSAPVIEDYTGPVIFAGSAAADLMLNAVGLQCVGQRLPESDTPQLTRMMPTPKLAERLGRRGASDVVNVFDDPTVREFGGVKLAGAYSVDDQGVPAQKVTLIEEGTVESLLMSRRPRKEIPQSNGHARMPMVGVIGSDATIGNLFVESSEPKPFDELKRELVGLCNDEGLEFGLLIRKLDNEALTGIDVDSPEAMMSLYQRQMDITVGAPVAMYKVYAADGREELVRGIDVVTVNTRALRDIAAMGNDAQAHNVLVSPGGGVFGGIGMGIRISATVPAAVVTPSVLFEEFDLKAATGAKKRPTVLAHPSFEKK